MIPTTGEESPLSGESTVKSALARFLAEVSARKSPTTHARECRKAGQISARLGELPLNEVSALDLSEYRDQRLKEASAAIVQADLELLKELFDVAAGQWGIAFDGNPVHGVSPPRAAVERSRMLVPGELVRLLAACDRRPTPMLGWIVRLALQTAMNKEDLLRIRRCDLDLKNRVLTLPKLMTRAGRQVPLTKEAVRLFQTALNHPDRPEDEELLFYGSVGSAGVRHPVAIDKAFRSVVMQARLKGFRFSDLRQESIRRMRDAGLTDGEIFHLVGLALPRGARRPPRPVLSELVARLDEVGLGVSEK